MNKNILSTLGAFLSMFGIVILSAMVFTAIIKENVETDSGLPLCTQADLYELEMMSKEWRPCENGIQTRPLIRKDSFNCQDPGKVSAPELERSCEQERPIFILPEQKVFKIIEEDLSLLDVKTKDTPNVFPKFKVNHTDFEKAYIRATIGFNDFFKENYRNLIEGRNAQTLKPARHIFALKYFINTPDNGGFVDVIRKDSGAVDLWVDGGLLGAYTGKEIEGGKEFIVDLELVKVAVETDEMSDDFRYKMLKPELILKNSVGKEVLVGLYLSDNEGTLIKSMDIIYEGKGGAFELVK